jgi:16S rRNA (adenine1518-N6/adenine1519-N6)-dimethyltransferase
MNRDELFALLQKYRLKPDKKLGQHYLLDESILASTIAAASIEEGELVLEIGGGPGLLTKKIAEAGADVLTVEFDRNFAKLLQEEFHNWRNVHVLCDDALRLDFSDLQRDDKPYRKIVANIPYQITSPLVRKILEPKSTITVAVLLIQKEVADRLMASPGSRDRGWLTIYAEYFGSIEKVVAVPPASFWPAPEVESTVIKIVADKENRKLATPELESAFFWLVRQGFSGKRKMLNNSLAGGLQLDKSAAMVLVEKAQLDGSVRPEDLSLEQWLNLFAAYQELFVEQ